MLDLKRLRLLRELEARGTIAAVADALHFSRSAVSQQLSKLEVEAGTPLLEHVGRNVRLTDAGRTLVRHAAVLLRQLEHAEAELEASQGQVRGIVRVGVFQTAAISLLPGALVRLGDKHPQVRVEARQAGPERTVPALHVGELDVVIGQSYDHSPLLPLAGPEHEVILRDDVSLALPRDHFLARGQGPVELWRLADEAWVAGEAGTGFGDMAVRICQSIGGFRPDVRYRSSDFAVLIALVAAGLAVALVPNLAHVETDSRIAVRELEGTPPMGRDIFFAARPGSAARPAIAAFLTALRASCR